MNKNTQRIRTALFALLFTIAGMTNAFAQDFTVGKLKFSVIDDNSVSVKGPVDGAKAKGKFVIPETIVHEGITYSVVRISSFAFQNCSGLTNVTIPSSVTSIDDAAFLNCTGLANVAIPNSVNRLGEHVLFGSGWYNKQPNGILYLSDCCLGYKGYPPTGTLSIRSNTRLIAKKAFYDCKDLKGKAVVPNLVKHLGDYAFAGCKGLTSVTLPNSVISLGEGAFNGCSGLTSIIIPDSVTSMGAYAFSSCEGLTTVTISKSLTYIEVEAFEFCKKLTSVIIPNSVAEIKDGSFSHCYGLTGSLIIPNSVSFIAPNAFSGCSGFEQIIVESGNKIYDSRDNCNAIIETGTNKLILGCKSTVIPNSVTIINDYAFSGCAQLTSVNIPNSVTSIGSGAFKGCVNLTSINIPSSVVSLGSNITDGNPFYNTGWYNRQPEGIIYLDNCCLGWKGKAPIGELKIKNGTRLIAACAFLGCEELTSVFIPSSMRFIGIGAFFDCYKLASAIIESPYLRELSYNKCFGNFRQKTNIIYK